MLQTRLEVLVKHFRDQELEKLRRKQELINQEKERKQQGIVQSLRAQA